MKKTSIRDVAAFAGVSTATVSHILNGTRFVSEETIQKVNEAVKVLQYTPNMAARGFRTGKTNTIGFVLPDISNHFFSYLVEVIENTLSLNNYHLIIALTKENIELEQKHLQYFSAGIADGIILASTATDSSPISEVLPSGFPITFIDRCPKNLLWDSVTISSEIAVNEAVDYLCKKGHKKIGFLSGLHNISTTVERLNAYKASMQRNGLPFDDSMVSFGNSLVENTKTGAVSLVEAGCTAIVVCNGLMTYEAQQFLWDSNSQNYRSDIDIVGFKEDYRLVEGNAYISQPLDDLGVRTAGQILTRINNPNMPIKETILNSIFVY